VSGEDPKLQQREWIYRMECAECGMVMTARSAGSLAEALEAHMELHGWVIVEGEEQVH
jgi:hypothetical protein